MYNCVDLRLAIEGRHHDCPILSRVIARKSNAFDTVRVCEVFTLYTWWI